MDGTLTLLASTPLTNAAGGAITGTDVTVSNDDSTLYVNEAANGTIGAYAINPDGTVTQLPGSPYTTATAPARRRWASPPTEVQPEPARTAGAGGRPPPASAR